MGKIVINNKSYIDNGAEYFVADNKIQRCIKELGLGLAELSVYLFYIRCQNNNNQARPTMEYIMRETPIKSKDTVRKSIRNLEKAGLLEQLEKGHSGKASVYKVNYVYMADYEAVEPKKVNTPPAKEKPSQGQIKGNLFTSRGKHSEIMTSKEAEEIAKEFAGYEAFNSKSFDLI